MESTQALLARAQRLVSKIISTRENPSPKLLHALASIFETQEARYLEESGNASFHGDRRTHTIGSLGNLFQGNDNFFELISSKFLLDSRYSTSVHAAAARLLVCYLPTRTVSALFPINFNDAPTWTVSPLFPIKMNDTPTWTYPHVFKDVVLNNI
ncbi:hypothetical protein H6P81_018096 [Aristolochia fimbriata]|uniref:Uncharacterized protein n=1 Tax=Aristolochia fimbriata TaxID=158543 RepID=A0AAV7E4B5_ARIFI|nr:hypothetical protein H6P81_018096 [Aristolochia fimbriata]